MNFMREHGKIYIGKDSLNQINDIVKNYSHPLLLLSQSSNRHSELDKIKKLFSNVMVKKSGEPTSEFIDNFVSNIKSTPDLIVAIGGGSLIDFAKVVAVLIANPFKKTKEVYGIKKRNKAINLVAVPTTAGTGTEVTGVSVVIDSESLLKFGVLGDDLVPKYAILDPILSVSLNLRYTISTGVDALTHALEAFCSKQSFYMTDLYAESAIKIIWETLPKLYDDLNNLQLRERMLYASMLAGIAFGTAGTGAVHGFAHIIGGKYGVSHGEANSILLSQVMWYNFDYNDRKIKSLFGSMGYDLRKADDFSGIIYNFLKNIDAPLKFSDIGVKKISVDDIYKLIPSQQRLFDKTSHIFTYGDVKNIFSSLI